MQINAENITIYVIGRNTATFALATILNTKKLYPEFADRIFYIDDNSIDNTQNLLKENNIPYHNVIIDTNELSEFKFISIEDEYPARNMLVIYDTLSKCNTDYALIMHSDMFFLNNQFLYKMINDMKNYKVSSVELLYDTEEKPEIMRLKILDKEEKFFAEANPEIKKYYEYYLNYLKIEDQNKIWAGLTLFNLKYFKDNNLPFCDRLDKKNKYCIGGLYTDTMQDFQCFLIENNIPWTSYNYVHNRDNILHVTHASCINTHALVNSGIEMSMVNDRIAHGLEVFKIKKYRDGFKLIAKNTGISLSKILKGFQEEKSI